MTVAELIAKLLQFDPNMDVCFEDIDLGICDIGPIGEHKTYYGPTRNVVLIERYEEE
jgi:hypothetical protein